MSDRSNATPAAVGDNASAWWIVLPIAGMALVGLWLVTSDWLSAFRNGAPPVEKLTFERTVLDGDGIHLKVRAGGSEPLTIAQVQVDEAYWTFTQDPPGPLTRLDTAWLRIPYPWVLGEAHTVKALTSTGATFDHTIDVAVATPRPQPQQLWSQALLGAVVGLAPVIIGMLFFPAIRAARQGGLNFVLALTVGLLAFLFIDSLGEAIEFASEAAETFQGPTMALTVAGVAFLGLFAVGRRHGTPTGLALATYIALGIGLHNLGEGLAIGAAFAAGIAGLGTFLVFGFTLHNVTEGVGIVAPLAEERPPLWIFGALAMLAGAPAIIGVWLGSLSTAPQWSALALAIGAGAILQVIVEVGAYLVRRAGDRRAWLSPGVLSGFVVGVAVMYLTAVIAKV